MLDRRVANRPVPPRRGGQTWNPVPCLRKAATDRAQTARGRRPNTTCPVRKGPEERRLLHAALVASLPRLERSPLARLVAASVCVECDAPGHRALRTVLPSD